MSSDVLRCSQMLSDDHRCFWIFSRYSIDVLLMFSRCSLDVPRMFAGFFEDVFRMLRWVLWALWNLMIISNESMDFSDPGTRWSPTIWWSQLFDDLQLFDDRLEVWTLIIQKSTVIPPSLMVLFSVVSFWRKCSSKARAPLSFVQPRNLPPRFLYLVNSFLWYHYKKLLSSISD